ncbi:hypothetical protein FQN54_004996 [Arachnomyces sp. PD_36]|nr:hypothetical protein FQN54_004996 [Arachnomyces sp. PD_36]
MAAAPPLQLGQPGVTYLDIPAIRLEIQSLTPSSSEGQVNGVWNSILNSTFPNSAGYITRPQNQHNGYGGQRGFSDFHTFHYVRNEAGEAAEEAQGGEEGGPLRRRYFLITQCKSCTREYADSVWNEGENQLEGYIRGQHGCRPVGERTPVYGILANGRHVKFFKYHDSTQTIQLWRPGTPIDGGRYFFHLRNEANRIQQALNFIRTHH